MFTTKKEVLSRPSVVSNNVVPSVDQKRRGDINRFLKLLLLRLS
jgi:hypothetical protein